MTTRPSPFHAVAVAALSATLAAAAQPAPGAGVIAGRVVEEGTSSPIADARVFLFPLWRPGDGPPQPNGPPQQHQVMSGPDGVFRFEGLAPGRYGVRAEKTGYAMSGPGSGPPAIVELEAGRPGVAPAVRLQRGGVIAGRVLSPTGEPMAEARVTAMRRLSNSMRSPRSPIGSTTPPMTISGPPAVTNDLGEFRIHSLAPGDYYVQASPRFEPPNAQNTPTVTTKIAPTFYPGATDVAGAQPIAIGAGATLTGIEIGLLRAQAFSIRGVVVDEEGRPVANAMVMLTHDPTQGIPTFTPSSQARTAPDGSFAIEGILNGSYRLSAAAASTSKIERIGVSGGIVSSSGGFGGPVGRVMTETRNGVTSQYLFDPQDEIRITVQGDHLTGVQLIAKRPTP